MVIVVTPLINYVSGFVQRPEPMGIQALFAELAIKAFNECILLLQKRQTCIHAGHPGALALSFCRAFANKKSPPPLWQGMEVGIGCLVGNWVAFWSCKSDRPVSMQATRAL